MADFGAADPACAPAVVLAGAPKTGTTALADALGQHPSVILSAPKEPRFFYRGQNFSGPLSAEFNQAWARSAQEYTASFSDKAANTSPKALTLDASTDYLAQPESADRLAQRNPQAKVIIGLRHPVARAFSEHVHLLRENAETLSFADAIGAELDRRAKNWVPLFHHLHRSRYGPGMHAFTSLFDTFIYHHEDLVAEPNRVCSDLSFFLELDPPIEVPVKANTAGSPRSAALNAIVRPRSPMLISARAKARRSLGPDRLARIRCRLDRWNLEPVPFPDLELHDKLIERLEPDIAAVEQILDQPLPQWRVYPAEWESPC